jgi:hypothetical protein
MNKCNPSMSLLSRRYFGITASWFPVVSAAIGRRPNLE